LNLRPLGVDGLLFVDQAVVDAGGGERSDHAQPDKDDENDEEFLHWTGENVRGLRGVTRR
jgi:hypothetical protein